MLIKILSARQNLDMVTLLGKFLAQIFLKMLWFAAPQSDFLTPKFHLWVTTLIYISASGIFCLPCY